jgi:hypothetical protein
MGLFLKQNEQRSQLQTKIAADLSARLNKEPGEIEAKKVQPAILDDQRQTSPLAWVWIILGAVALVGVVVALTQR